MTLFSRKPVERCVPDEQLRWVHNSDLFLLAILTLLEREGIEDKALMDEIRERIKRGGHTAVRK